MSSTYQLSLSSLSLREKIGQLLIIKGNPFRQEYCSLGVGGVFIDNCASKEEYQHLIMHWQQQTRIPLLIATDMEGHWNPFPWYHSKKFGDIATPTDARALGEEHGRLLKEMGFTLNFSPVVEARDDVWQGRCFRGTYKERNAKIAHYIKGLKRYVCATAKHYPGKNMIHDPHHFFVHSYISQEDLSYFQTAIDAGVKAIMVGHAIVSGASNSRGKQATISPEVIAQLRSSFNGLIITDAISMLGLRLSYVLNRSRIYVDCIKAGNDCILDSAHSLSPRAVVRGIAALEQALCEGALSEQRLNKSVQRIFALKGQKRISLPLSS